MQSRGLTVQSVFCIVAQVSAAHMIIFDCGRCKTDSSAVSVAHRVAELAFVFLGRLLIAEDPQQLPQLVQRVHLRSSILVCQVI